MRKRIATFALLGIIGLGLGLTLGFSLFSPKADANTLVLYGNVDIREVDLGFRVFGKVQEVFFDEGDRVQEGDVLATLDPIPYEQQLLEATAQLAYAEVAFVNSEKQFTRRASAIKSSAISEEDYQNALAQVEELNATVLQARASLDTAKTACDDTKLRAPCEGTLLSRIREPGSVLNPGQPVFTLSLDAPIWIRAYVAEPDLGKIYPGMKAIITTDTDSNPSYEGQIGFISPVAEFTPKNVETTDLRTELVYRIRVMIPTPAKGLRQGMPVTVKLPLDNL